MTQTFVLRQAGFANKGAEAMLLAARNAVLRNVPDARILVQTKPEQALRASVEGLVPLLPQNGSGREFWRSLSDIRFRHDDFRRGVRRTRHEQAIQMRAAGPCHVIDLAGFAYGDDWPESQADTAVGWKNHALASGCRAVFAPQAWGPFAKPAWRNALPKMLDGALFYARDARSQELLRDAAGIDAPLRRDVAFSFDGGDRELGARLLGELPWKDAAKPLVVVTPNVRLYERSEGSGSGNAMVRAVVGTARRLRSELDCRVLLLGNEMSLSARAKPDDRHLCALAEAVCGMPGEVVAMRKWLSAAEVRSILMNAEMAVSARYHSILLAATAGCPVLALSWSHKYEYLLEDVGLGGWIVRGENGEWDRLAPRALELWEARRETRGVLDETAPRLRKEATEFLDDLTRRMVSGS
ncbi:MAG: polysaccharide pyruvyl transferase family protein [Fibrobacterales bacterium]|nr:polysaccharide pyruvyl transferase family protein [Fibrobacterales bacterium]MBP5187829.1 polysaccharide pyruvyl transferase family protein [Fibrobacterales bacterium]MBP5350655.1 polysaccharide pyruvyl transferase family protein [Fibrobacterales bacterium]